MSAEIEFAVGVSRDETFSQNTSSITRAPAGLELLVLLRAEDIGTRDSRNSRGEQGDRVFLELLLLKFTTGVFFNVSLYFQVFNISLTDREIKK